MSSPSGPAAVFHRVAETYDNVGVPWFRPIAAGLITELAVQPDERALDIGCGRGAALIPLADAVGPTGTVLGIDLAPAMVELTAADVADRPHVAVQLGDAAAPSLPPRSFDVIASSLVLFFLPDPGAALHNWVRLAVPGGRIGVSTFAGQDERWQRIDALFTPYLPQQMLDARTSGRRGAFGSDEAMAGLFSASGLTDVRTARHTTVAEFRDAAHFVEFTWSHGQRAMWEAVPPAERPQLENRIVDLVHDFAGDGRLQLNQDVRYTLGRRPA